MYYRTLCPESRFAKGTRTPEASSATLTSRMPAPSPTDLFLRPISRLETGETVAPLHLSPELPSLVIGRTSVADWTVPDMTVSRRHASIDLVNGEWLMADLGSRHGTWLNGQQVAPGERLPLRSGDQIRFGRWACRCEGSSPLTSRLTSVLDAPGAGRVRPIPPGNLSGVAQQRLEALLEASRQLATAGDRESIARTVALCTAAGTGCARVLVVRPAGSDAFDVLASTTEAEDPRLSRTLLDAAMLGVLVQLAAAQTGFDAAQSLIDLEIRSAICAPLLIGGLPDSLLYLDSRGSEGVLPSDVAAFCNAMAQLGGLATERLLAAEMTLRREQLERDMLAARNAQQLLMPGRSGTRSGFAYCFESVPGRFVAGDLFDVVDLPDGRTAFFLGDVSGKGVGAGLLMAAAQTLLQTLLSRGEGLPEALVALNEHVHARTDPGTFLTLLAGVFEPEARVVTLADAGHGLACLCDGRGGVERLAVEGGLPIGVASAQAYRTQSVALPAGSRLVLFSDGVVEQTDAAGRQFGMPSALRVLASTDGPGTDVAAMLTAVRTHADGPLADDVTVVSIASEHDRGASGGRAGKGE